MSTALRSEGWSVRPSFVPNGAVTPITLLADENALTQLAGEPPVAWQTPWSELSNIQIVRFARSMALFATAAGVRYCWRNPSRTDFEALRSVVVAHGGVVARHRRRAGLYSVAVIVLVAALAGGIGSWLYRNSSGSRELTELRDVNLTVKDLPTGWYQSSDPGTSVLSYLFTAPGKVLRLSTTPTTQPKANSVWAHVSTVFQQCLGVSAKRDRMYGSAGQEPDYQISSPIFNSSSYGGIEVVSTAQYYQTTTMVHRDTAEMTRANFGSCFVTSNVALVRAVLGVKVPTTNIGTNFRPTTFLRGWSRGGQATMTLPNVPGTPHLIMVVITGGHYEVTLGVLVNQWPKSEALVSNLTSTLLSRVESPSSKPV
ncbi:MAG: hypothetical protein ABSA07_09565 [Acidimicrobiales bacterium]|jgi:hypothetical protein